MSYIAEGLRPLAVPIGDIREDPKNVRKHSPANLQAIARSYERFGQRKAIVVNRRTGGTSEAGSGQLQAARDILHWSHIAVVYVDDDEQTARAFAIADNRTGELAEWDNELLALDLQELETAGMLEATGFSGDELRVLLEKTTPVNTEEDELPTDVPTRCQPGEIWRCGAHRVMCGDSTNAEDVARLLDGVKCETLVFDPEWDAGFLPQIESYKSTLVFGDGASIGNIIAKSKIDPAWVFAWDCGACWYTPNRPLRRIKLCVWYGDILKYNPDGWFYGEPDETKIVTNTRGSYRYRPDPRGKHLSDLYQYQITRLHSDEDFSHSKPLNWICLLLANCTTGDVYDPFIGSGTTLIAAERTGRVCYGMEISAKYCDVILARWEKETGGQAVLSARGSGDGDG